VRARPKHEHIAAAHLRQHGVEVFLPRIRFKRSRSRGPVWVTEALFPNYLFARFNLKHSLRAVMHARGVAGVVHFGTHWPSIPDELIDELRIMFGREEVHEIPAMPEIGDEIKISGGVFHGFKAVVSQIMPARDRVKVLLNFLGRQTTTEIAVTNLVQQGERKKVL
jgi:transcriptional antiterminator RfaH